MKKQSSIEWLVEMLVQECGLDNDGDIALFIIEQAKQMHKKEIIEAHCDWKRIVDKLSSRSADEYYKNTYEKES